MSGRQWPRAIVAVFGLLCGVGCHAGWASSEPSVSGTRREGLAFVDSVLLDKPPIPCVYLNLRLRPQRSEPREAEGCLRYRADTIYYLYRYPSNVVVAGRRYSVPLTRLVHVSDSLEAWLQAQYGPTETCPIGDEFYAMRHRRWRHADYTLQLWVDSLPELHGVTVEAEVGDQPCDAFVGIPFAS